MKNKSALAILVVAIVIVMSGHGIIIPFIPKYINSHDYPLVYGGLLIAIYWFAMLLFSPFFGKIVTDNGSKKIMSVGLILFIAAITMTFLIDNYLLLLLARFIGGLGVACVYPAVENYVGTNYLEKDKVRALFVITAASGVGVAIGPIIGLLILKFSATTSLIIYTVIITLTILGINRCLEKDNSKLKFKYYLKNFFKLFLSSFKDLKRYKTDMNIIYILIGFLVYGFVVATFEATGLQLIYEYYDLNNNLLLPAVVVTSIISLVYLLYIYPYYLKKKNIIYNLGLIAVTAAILLFTLKFYIPFILFVVMLIFSFALIASYSNGLLVYVTENIKDSGYILGVKNSFISLGSIMGSILGAVVYQYDAFNIFLLTSLIFVIIGIYAIVLDSK